MGMSLEGLEDAGPCRLQVASYFSFLEKGYWSEGTDCAYWGLKPLVQYVHPVRLTYLYISNARM